MQRVRRGHEEDGLLCRSERPPRPPSMLAASGLGYVCTRVQREAGAAGHLGILFYSAASSKDVDAGGVLKTPRSLSPRRRRHLSRMLRNASAGEISRRPFLEHLAGRVLYTLGDGHFVACRSVVKLYSQVGVSKHMHRPDVCSSFMWRTPSLVTTTQCSECCIWQIMHMNSE